MRSPTAYKFRHYKRDPKSGLQLLDWASQGPRDSIDLSGREIFKGSKEDIGITEDQEWTSNALADEGEVDILDVYFDAQAVRTSLYFTLYNDTPVETDGLTDLTGIVTGTGYGSITVTRGTDWGVPTAGGGTTTVTKTFTAGGAWSAATYLILQTTTDTSGLLLAYAALSQSRTLANGDTLDVTMTVTLE
jgi:hypothetical protein